MMQDYETTLKILGDTTKKMSRRELRGLSDIGREFESDFLDAWHMIDLKRRREIARAMIDVTEDNVDFDFRDVFSACLRDTDPEVRMSAVEGLVEDDRPRTMRQLIVMLSDDPDDDVRAATALALGRFGYLASLDELGAADASQLRAALFGAAANLDLAVDVRRRALESLGYFSGADVDQVIAAAYASGDAKLKESSVAAIGHSLDQRWLPVLQAELRSSEPAMCYEAARASGEFGEAGSTLIPLLLPLTTGDDVQIFTTAIWALGQIGGDTARGALRRLAQSEEPARQEAAQEALGEIEIDGSAPQLF